MKCKECGRKAVISGRCKDHFLQYVEVTVRNTIKKYKLVTKTDSAAVACSGGKDSTVLLSLLHRFGYNVTALAIDEGIPGYRDRTLDDLKRFCKDNSIQLKIVSFRKMFGHELEALLSSGRLPCTVCGILRRNLLNKYGRKFDVIATGHNLDDEAQSILMNLLQNHSDILARLGPKTGVIKDKLFSTRVKPLYFLKEKEITAYAYLKGIGVEFTECPYAPRAMRSSVRKELNDIEFKEPGTKLTIVEQFLAMLPMLRETAKREGPVESCSLCGEPSSGDRCKGCKILSEVVA